ncbi:MAG: globin family protein [Planctomycetota bacterium]
MTPEQVDMVQESWEKCVPIADTAAELFYGKLFELDPTLRPLFPEDMSDQKKKLMQMITTAVRGLKDLEALVPAVQALGKRHVGYKVTAPMYDTVGAALLDTLEKGLGEAWNDDLKEAWTLTYGTLAKVMIDASEE